MRTNHSGEAELSKMIDPSAQRPPAVGCSIDKGIGNVSGHGGKGTVKVAVAWHPEGLVSAAMV